MFDSTNNIYNCLNKRFTNTIECVDGTHVPITAINYQDRTNNTNGQNGQALSMTNEFIENVHCMTNLHIVRNLSIHRLD